MNATHADKRISLRDILFLTDFSEASGKALPIVRGIALEYGANVWVLHVLVPEVLTYATPDSFAAATALQEKSAEAEMGRVDAQLGEIPHGTIVRPGKDVWAALQPMLKEGAVDLIALGAQGRTGLPKVLLGSTAEELFVRSPVPVMTIGPSVHSQKRNGARWERVLLPCDFSPESRAAAPYAISFAEENDAQLILLHVIREWGPRKETKREGLTVAEAMHQLYEIVPPEAGLWCRPKTVVEYGEPAARILEVANDREVDLIVLGVRGSGHLLAATHLEAFVAHEVVAHAPCAVLSVRS